MTRILVVDDKEENRYYLRALFEGHGYDVTTASQGAEALEAARADPPDLIVADLLMPVMDGYTLLRHWKADERLNGVPFVVYTATYTEPEDERLALDLGADAFIVKPAEPEYLAARVRDLLEAPSSAAATPRVPVGDEGARLEAYSRVLVRKLEQKMFELEEANRALHQDLLERARSQRRLEEATALLRLAGRVAHLGGWALDTRTRSLTWSDETSVIHDMEPGSAPSLEEVIGLVAPEDRDDFRAHLDACMEEGAAFDEEVRVVTRRRREVWVRIIGEPAWDDDGRVIRVQGAVQDISERKRLELQLFRAKRMESISALTGGIAHDLGNVLAPILLSAQMLKLETDDENTLDALVTIESCARRGAEMVKQVLSFARGGDRTRRPVVLDRIFEDLRRMVQETFPASIDLRTDIPPDLWPFDGDATQILQVLMNLFANARDAMPDGGHLSVTADNVDVDAHYAHAAGHVAPGPYVRISLADSGEGMSDEVLGQIFDPLFTTKPEGKGTGLGLATVAAIVRDHGGFVHAYSELGEGTVFRLHFPASGPDEDADAPAPALDALQGNDELVLVVDDEGAVRSLTRETLQAFGYRVVTAADGADALEVYRRLGDEVSVVLTDVGMPVVDGPTAIRSLLRLDPTVRIVATSGSGRDDAERRAVEAGARYFLPKPYTADALLSVIHRALGSSGHPDDPSTREELP